MSNNRHTSMDRVLLTGIAWTGSIKWMAQGFSWVTTLVVARFLTPDDYGILGLSVVVLGLLGLLAEFGVGTVIVLRHDLSKRVVRELAGLAPLLGLLGLGACFAVAPMLAQFFRVEALRVALPALGIGFVLSGIRTVPWSLLQRGLRFKRLAIIDASQSISASALSVAMAVGGFGYWALIIPNLIGSALAAAMAAHSSPIRPALPTRAALRSVGWLSGHLLFQRLSWFSYSQLDSIIIGRMLGQTDLGIYTFGTTLASAPSVKINETMARVTTGVFSAVQEERDELRRYLLSIMEVVSLLVFPVLTFLGLLAPWISVTLFGDEWTALGAPLRVLAAAAVLRSLMGIVTQVLTVIYDQRFLSMTVLILVVCMPVGFMVGTNWGVAGVATTWLVVYPVVALTLLWRCSFKLQFSPFRYFSATSAATVLTAMAVGVHFAVYFMMREAWGRGVDFSTTGGVAAAGVFYLSAVGLRYGNRVRLILSVLKPTR